MEELIDDTIDKLRTDAWMEFHPNCQLWLSLGKETGEDVYVSLNIFLCHLLF